MHGLVHESLFVVSRILVFTYNERDHFYSQTFPWHNKDLCYLRTTLSPFKFQNSSKIASLYVANSTVGPEIEK